MLMLTSWLDHPLVSLLVKISAVWCLAGIAAQLLRRAAAATRHMIWTTAMIAVIGLTLLSSAAPRIMIDIPVAIAADANPPAIETAAAEFSPSITSRVNPSNTVEAPTPWYREFLNHPLRALWIVWLTGIAAIVGRTLLAHWAMRRIVSTSARHDSGWSAAALRTLAEQSGVRRTIHLHTSTDVDAPLTSGIARPVIVLPSNAVRWSSERWHVVLLHELAHVARLDYLVQLVGTAATALWWFHPLAWLAVRRLRVEAEHAADDHVLAHGMSGVSYATHLIDLARPVTTHSLPAAIAIGMARPGQLEGRLRAMLDHTRRRRVISPATQWMIGMATLIAVVPLAGVRTRLVAVTPEMAAAQDPGRTVRRTPTPARGQVYRGEEPSVARTTSRGGDSTIEKAIDARPGDQLRIELRTGGEIDIRTHNDSSVVVRARLAGSNWPDTRVSLERDDADIVLRSDFPRRSEVYSASHVFELWVPRHFNVSINSSGGAIHIRDLDGHISGQTGGGDITIDRSSGSLTLATGGGDVVVNNSDLDGFVRTGGGHVDLSNTRGDLRGESAGGVVTTSAGRSRDDGADMPSMNRRFGTLPPRPVATPPDARRPTPRPDMVDPELAPPRMPRDNMPPRSVPPPPDEPPLNHPIDADRMQAMAERMRDMAARIQERTQAMMQKQMMKRNADADELPSRIRPDNADDLDTPSRAGELKKRQDELKQRQQETSERSDEMRQRAVELKQRMQEIQQYRDEMQETERDIQQQARDMQRAMQKSSSRGVQEQRDMAEHMQEMKRSLADQARAMAQAQVAMQDRVEAYRRDHSDDPDALDMMREQARAMRDDVPTRSPSINRRSPDAVAPSMRRGAEPADGSATTIRKAGGPIDIDDLPNGGHLQTGGGNISVGSSNGDVVAITGGGNIELRNVRGSAHTSTGAGNTAVSISGNGAHDVDIVSGNGSVTVDLPAGFSGRLELVSEYTRNYNGQTHIKSDWKLDTSESPDWETDRGTPRKTVRAVGQIGNGRSVIRVRTVNGDVTVRRR